MLQIKSKACNVSTDPTEVVEVVNQPGADWNEPVIALNHLLHVCCQHKLNDVLPQDIFELR